MSDKDALGIMRADALVAGLKEQYPDLVAQDLETLVACWRAIQAETAAGQSAQANYEKLYRMAHDFKGHAGSYGYPLASAIASSICQLVKSGRVKTNAECATLDSRVKGLELVIKQRLSDDASEGARKLLVDLAIDF